MTVFLRNGRAQWCVYLALYLARAARLLNVNTTQQQQQLSLASERAPLYAFCLFRASVRPAGPDESERLVESLQIKRPLLLVRRRDLAPSEQRGPLEEPPSWFFRAPPPFETSSL